MDGWESCDECTPLVDLINELLFSAIVLKTKEDLEELNAELAKLQSWLNDHRVSVGHRPVEE